MIMASGGYYDRMHKDESDWMSDASSDLKLPPGLPPDVELRTVRLHRLGRVIDM